MNPKGRDRGDQPYAVMVNRETYAAMIISPTRQARKALKVSGRQWRKMYKAANRAEAARKRAIPKPPRWK